VIYENDIVLIVVHYGDIRITLEFIESYYNSSIKPNLIIISNMDKNNTSELYEKIKMFFGDKVYYAIDVKDLQNSKEIVKEKKILLVRLGINAMWAGANNVGIFIAQKLYKPKYFWLLNNDVILEKDTIYNIIKILDLNDDFSAIFTGIYGECDDFTLKDLRTLRYYNSNEKELSANKLKKYQVAMLGGASLIIKNDIFESYPFIDESYYFYWEDVDIGKRILIKGKKIKNISEIKVFHKQGASTNFEDTLYLDYRARLKFIKKYYNNFWVIYNRLLIALVMCLRILFVPILELKNKIGIKKRVKMYSKAMLAAIKPIYNFECDYLTRNIIKRINL